MTDSGLPAEVQRFLSQNIDSVEQLEILLLLARSSPKVWRPDDVATELRVSALSVQKRLSDLQSRRLIVQDGVGFLFAAQSPARGAVQQVADAYRERRVAVITFIFTKPPGSIQALADAFKVK